MAPPAAGLRSHVLKGIAWRSGSQIAVQLVTWLSTFMVIRLLRPADYGMIATTQGVIMLFSMLGGQGFAAALIRQEELEKEQVRQVFGLLVTLNLLLALVQCMIAPLIAAYYRQPMIVPLLCVQSLLYLANPFIAIGGALLSQRMDFRRQALANVVSTLAGAATAFGSALAGFGIWTLVAAPLAMSGTRALFLAIGAPIRIWPSFRLGRAGEAIRFGAAMMVSQLFWFVQTQSDIVIGGRSLDPHHLGLYTTALFLAQILTAKFIPPINEVAYSAYARIQNDRPAVAAAFVRSVRMIMLLTLPFHIGMALTAGPLVRTVLGDHWIEAVPIVASLALAMPFVTLQILFFPVTNALGRPRHAVYGAVAGAIIMPAAFAIGAPHGALGLAGAWSAAFPLLTLFTAAISLPVMGLKAFDLIRAIVPAVVATGFMAAAVLGADHLLPPLRPLAHLSALMVVGMAAYAVAIAILALSVTSVREAIPQLKRGVITA